jgi:N-acetylneuraminate lyase
MTNFRLAGLTAATLTPFDAEGCLRLDQVGHVVDHLVQSGVSGLYVCGSTGEGISLTNAERQAVAKAYVDAAGGRVPVIVQVGQNSLIAAQELAAHAQAIGADAISATSPSYFKLDHLETLIDAMELVTTSAPKLPFYYYHIPVLTGVDFDMVEFLQRAAPRIQNLVGLKFTNPALDQFQQCMELDNGKYDILWGVDEMMLGALATGATGAVGSTFNIAAPVYLRTIDAFRRGDMEQARYWQSRSIGMIRVMASYPFHPALHEVMKLLGMDCGPCRLPHRPLTDGEAACLKNELESIGFFEWCGAGEDQQHLRHDAASNGQPEPSPAIPSRRHERI